MAKAKKAAEPAKKKVGRPAGSTNKSKATATTSTKRRGRPAGSTNKPKGNPFAHMLSKSSEKNQKKTASLISGKRRKKAAAEPAKRGRGRPAKSLNKKTMQSNWDAFTSSNITKKKRGRPAGKRDAVARLIRGHKDWEGTKHEGMRVDDPNYFRNKKKATKAAKVGSSGKKRGRPVGSKDKAPRKRRGSSTGGTMGVKVSAIKKSAVRKVATVKAVSSKRPKAIVNHTPTKRIGKVMSGKKRIPRAA